MPIELVTGLPGAGKSVGAVARLVQMREAQADRPVFVLGIDGLKDGIAQLITDDDLRHWYEYPAGSIFVIDECQKYMPMRRSGDPPDWIRKLSEHRHLGHDFLLCTQAPGYLDTYVRGLVDRHTHLVRKFGTHVVDRYEWPAVSMNPLSPSERKRAVHKVWKYPRACFDLYKSAELHTVKRRIPGKLIALAVVPVLLVAAVVAVPSVMRHGEKVGAATATATATGAADVSQAVRRGEAGEGVRVKWATPGEYVAAHAPRVAALPWSAPVYDDRAVVTEPDLRCISYEREVNGAIQNLCSCFTEQGTPYRVGSVEICRTYARDGVYNPYRRAMREDVRPGREADSLSARRNTTDSSAVRGVGAASAQWSPAWRSQPYIVPGSQPAYQPSAAVVQ